MAQDSARDAFPPLPLDEWEDTKDTLQLFLQIVGKVRLGLFPKTNHWWHVPFYVSSRGLTTRAIPYGARNFAIDFDFLNHVLKISTCEGERRDIAPVRLTMHQAVKDQANDRLGRRCLIREG